MDNKACKLEAEHEDKARIARLKRLAAEKAATTRAEAPAAMSETFQTGIERERGAGDGKPMNYTAGSASRSWARPCSTRYPKSGRPSRAAPLQGLRVGETPLSIYHAGESVATHRLLPPYVRDSYSTGLARMPETFAGPNGTTRG